MIKIVLMIITIVSAQGNAVTTIRTSKKTCERVKETLEIRITGNTRFKDGRYYIDCITYNR